MENWWPQLIKETSVKLRENLQLLIILNIHMQLSPGTHENWFQDPLWITKIFRVLYMKRYSVHM
jgi:hypothetical protein